MHTSIYYAKIITQVITDDMFLSRSVGRERRKFSYVARQRMDYVDKS